MQKTDYRNVGILVFVVLLIFYPLLYTHYFYTDEVLQLWNYRKGSSFAMFLPQGRWLTDVLFRYLYSSIEAIPRLTGLRIISLVIWLVCVPIWHLVITLVSRREGLPGSLPFLTVLYLVTSLPFAASVQWVACLELSFANTAGLLAGYCVYSALGSAKTGRFFTMSLMAAGLLLGVVSLFFYQNGIGCFLLPFFLQAIGTQRIDRKIITAAGFYFFIFVCYYLLFKWQMKVDHVQITDRGDLVTDPFKKLAYLLRKVIPGALYFNVAIDDHTVMESLLVVLLGLACMLFNFSRLPSTRYIICRLAYAGCIFGAFVLIYLPSLVLKENYASNRTMLALDLAVAIWVFDVLLRWLGAKGWQGMTVAVVSTLLVTVACYNFRILFLCPAVDEYTEMRTFIGKTYTPAVKSVDFIMAPEAFVRQRYHIQSSWDEFGMSSSHFGWVPEALVKQLVFEKTGDRSIAEQIEVRCWIDKQTWQAAGGRYPSGSLWMDAAAILR